MGNPQNHGFQYSNVLMTWMIWGTPILGHLQMMYIQFSGPKKAMNMADSLPNAPRICEQIEKIGQQKQRGSNKPFLVHWSIGYPWQSFGPPLVPQERPRTGLTRPQMIAPNKAFEVVVHPRLAEPKYHIVGYISPSYPIKPQL